MTFYSKLVRAVTEISFREGWLATAFCPQGGVSLS